MLRENGRPDHRIRLRGPWEYLWLKGPAGLADDQRQGQLHLPATWSEAFESQAGTVRLSRSFGRPTGLDDGERVWLEVDTACETSVLLNGDWLGTLAPGICRVQVTERLAGRNRLDLEMNFDETVPSNAGIVEIALVIQPLRDE